MANALARVAANTGIRRVVFGRSNAETVILQGIAYRLYTWDTLERDSRSPGLTVTYHGTEARLDDDGTPILFRIFAIQKIGSPTSVQVAVPA